MKMSSNIKVNGYSGKMLAFFCILVCAAVFAQKSKQQLAIDNQIEIANGFYKNYKTKDFLKISKDIIEKSENVDYDKGLAYGNFYIAAAFTEIGSHKESIRYIHKCQSYKEYLKSDRLLDAKNFGLLGTNYNYLELFSLSVKNFRKAIEILNNKAEVDEAALRSEAVQYGNLSIVYERIGKLDSMYYSLNREKNILSKLNAENNYVHRSASYISFGNYFVKRKNADSARFYYERAGVVLENKNHPYEVDLLMGLGDLNEEQEKYNEAIDLYSQAAEISKKRDSWELAHLYEKLEDVYKKTSDFPKASAFNALFKKTNDSLEAIKKIERDYVVSELMKIELEEETRKNRDTITKVSSVVIILIIIASFTAYYLIRRNRRKLLKEKETIINQKEEETQVLKVKVNEAFDEVIVLAKTNSPEFWGRFQEVYPDFRQKLLLVNPELKPSELILSAYIYLGFNTKDIAEYTFKAVKTIKNNKYNLRKRLEILTKDDFTIWMRNYLD